MSGLEKRHSLKQLPVNSVTTESWQVKIEKSSIISIFTPAQRLYNTLALSVGGQSEGRDQRSKAMKEDKNSRQMRHEGWKERESGGAMSCILSTDGCIMAKQTTL